MGRGVSASPLTRRKATQNRSLSATRTKASTTELLFRHTSGESQQENLSMCDEFIHQGLTHDPTVSRRSFMKATAATAVLSSVPVIAQARVVEKDVNVAMSSGECDAALFYPEGKGTWPAVLVWTDILGLRPVFRDMGRRLATEGYVVLVPNPFYRKAKSPVVTGSFNFNNPDDRAKVMAMAADLTPENDFNDAKSHIDCLDAQAQTEKSARMGVQGYCMGGPLTFRTAAGTAGPDWRGSHLPWRRSGN
jgi:carboxymethylenebutenolidase